MWRFTASSVLYRKLIIVKDETLGLWRFYEHNKALSHTPANLMWQLDLITFQYDSESVWFTYERLCTQTFSWSVTLLGFLS